MQGQRGAQVVPLAAESVGQTGEAPHLHPRLVRGAGDGYLLGGYYRRRRVAALGIEPLAAEDLDELRIVDPVAQVLLDCGRVAVETVRRELESALAGRRGLAMKVEASSAVRRPRCQESTTLLFRSWARKV